MIFVTVGTHEQPFNRLVSYMDQWASNHSEEVVIQTGYSTYQPTFCKWQKLFSYQDMVQNVKDARIVITHGGPSSFIMPLQIKKIPIVIPRKAAYGEHVNDHQVDFCEAVAKRQGNIIVITEIDELANVLLNYDSLVERMTMKIESNNERFCKEFALITEELMNQ